MAIFLGGGNRKMYVSSTPRHGRELTFVMIVIDFIDRQSDVNNTIR